MEENTKKPIFTFDLPQDTLKTWTGIMTKLERTPEGKWVEVELGRNKVILGGLQDLCELLYHKPHLKKVISFEEDLKREAQDWVEIQKKEENGMPWIQGYNVAYDGSQGTDIIAYSKHKKGYTFDDIIPFRMIPLEDNNYDEFMGTYLHSRIVTVPDSEGAEHKYVAYYTKKIDIHYDVLIDNATAVPDNPDEELHTDKDIRVLAQFLINVTDKELREWFSIYKRGKMESTQFNALLTMCGKEATVTLQGKPYNTMIDTHVFSRCNHVSVPHGVDGTIACRYKMIHI